MVNGHDNYDDYDVRTNSAKKTSLGRLVRGGEFRHKVPNSNNHQQPKAAMVR